MSIGKKRRNLRPNAGYLGTSRRFILVFLNQETSMIISVFPLHAESILDPGDRIEAMLRDARQALIAVDAEVDAATAELAAIEPHPHAHGHTAAADCAYASIDPTDLVRLAGLLAQPWQGTLDAVEACRQEQGFDYLLNAFPAAFARFGDTLGDVGATLIEARADRIGDNLIALSERKPLLALGMVFRLFDFQYHKRDAWVGAFAYGALLPALVASTSDVTPAMFFGDALAATVAVHSAALSVHGKAELHKRASRRNAAKQASWMMVDENYRQAGSWRGLAPTKRQRHQMQRIEAARGLPMPMNARRGATSDAITDAGGNPRFDTRGTEKA